MPFHDYVNVDDPTDVLVDEIFISVHDEVPKTLEKNGKKYRHLSHFPGCIFKGGDWTGGPAAPGQTFMSSRELKDTRESEAKRRDEVARRKEMDNPLEREDKQSLTDGVQGKLRKLQLDAAKKKREEWKTKVPQ